MKIIYISAVLTATLAGGCASAPSSKPDSRLQGQTQPGTSVNAQTQDSQNCQVKDSDIAGKYTGECKSGLANGHGTARGRDEYTGSFVAGEADGQGTYTWANGSRYEGNWKSGKRDGSGKMIYVKGDEGFRNLGSRGVWVGNKYVVDGFWKDHDLVQTVSERKKDDAVTRNPGKLLGKRVAWTGFQDIDSDDCISILFHTVCHSVTYKFKFTGKVTGVDQNNGSYVVTLTNVHLIPQDFVAPMYWKYKGRAINWAAEQAGQARRVEYKYLSST